MDKIKMGKDTMKVEKHKTVKENRARHSKEESLKKAEKGAFSQSGAKKDKIERFTKHIDKGPKGFLTGKK